MRWRQYVRNMRKVNPGVVQQLADRQLAATRRYLRARALRGWIVVAVVLVLMVLALRLGIG